jgi:hypothetical protein
MSCGHEEQVLPDRRGHMVLCNMCGATIRVPEVRPKNDPFWQEPGFMQRPPTLPQRLAALFGLFSGLACLGTGAVILFAGAVPASNTGNAAVPDSMYNLGGKLMAVAAVYAVLGLVYLIGGMNVKRGGGTSGLTVMTLGMLHLLALVAAILQLLALRDNPKAPADVIRNVLIVESGSAVLIAALLLSTLAALAGHAAQRRVRCGWLFMQLSLYTYGAFALTFAAVGLTLFQVDLGGFQVPPLVMQHLGMVSGVWLAVGTLFWLLAASLKRTRIFAPVVALLVTLTLAGEGTLALGALAYRVLARLATAMDWMLLVQYLFVELIVLALIYLTARALFERWDGPLVSAQ